MKLTPLLVLVYSSFGDAIVASKIVLLFLACLLACLLVCFGVYILFYIVVASARAGFGLGLRVYEDHSYSNIFLGRLELLTLFGT